MSATRAFKENPGLKVSTLFNIPGSQDELDFIDVDTVGDVPLFIDPRAFRLARDPWATDCVTLLKTFFKAVIDAIRAGDAIAAMRLLSVLGEPNETHLGYSRFRASGRGVGKVLASELYGRLKESEAVKSGLLIDLEDTVLLIDRIGPDIVSDVVTNVVRAKLIEYTQSICRQFNVPVAPQSSGPLWDPSRREWFSHEVDLPVCDGRRFLFVRKSLLRSRLDYRSSEFVQHFVLEELQGLEKSSNSELVRLLKSGERHVYKKDVARKHGATKATAIAVTKRAPQLLDSYRKWKSAKPHPPLSPERLASKTKARRPNSTKLEAELRSSSGNQYVNLIGRLSNIAFGSEFDNQKRLKIDANNVGAFTFDALETEGPLSTVRAAFPTIQMLVIAIAGELTSAAYTLILRIAAEIANAKVVVIACRRNLQPEGREELPLLAGGGTDFIVLDDEQVISLVKARLSGDVASARRIIDAA